MAHRSSHFALILGKGRIVLLLTLASCYAAQSGCNVASDCGPNASCVNQLCECLTNYISPSGTKTDCRSINVPYPQCQSFDSQCVFCGIFNNGPCWLCGGTYFLSNQKCVTSCNTVGFSYQPVPNTTLYAKTCLTSGSNGSSLANWVIILIAILSVVCLAILVASILIVSCLCFRAYNVASFPVRQTSPTSIPPIMAASRFVPQQPSNDIPLAPTSSGPRTLPPIDALEDINIMTNTDDDEEAIFLQKLGTLRPQAVTFLDILNDIRKKTSNLPPQSATATHYKCVCQDLIRLLYLLNKKPKSVVMPPDGVQLLVWAEKVMAKYPKPVKQQQQLSRLSRIGEVDETNF